MKKYLLSIIIGLLLCSTAMAEEGHWYTGLSMGQTFRGFNLLDDEDLFYPIDDPYLQYLVGDDHLNLKGDEDFDTLGNSIFIGRTFGEKRSHALEFSFTNFGRYSVDIGGFARNEGPTFDIGDSTFTSNFDTTATGWGEGKLRGISLHYLHFFHLGKQKRLSVFPKVGFNYLWASVKGHVEARGEGYIQSTCDGEQLSTCRIGVFGEVSRDIEKKNYHIPSATVGAGITYKVSDHWKVRGEVTRTGLPWAEPYVDMYSVGFQYHF